MSMSPRAKGSSSEAAVVLLSAGLDSTYNLYAALKDGVSVLLALTFDYGQRAAPREIEQARKICVATGVAHRVVEVRWFSQFTRSSLVDRNAVIPTAKEVNIESNEVSQKTAERVWVPNRNGILLNIAAGFAEGIRADWVIPGFNVEEAQTFPDNSEDFMKALDHSFKYSTATAVRVHCYSTALTKIQIVQRAVELGVPLGDIWPCYFDEPKRCGQCESCQRFDRALQANGVRL